MQPLQQGTTSVFTETAKPLWDKQGALTRLGNNQALLKKVITLFQQQASDNVERLLAAIQSQDEDATRHYSHYLKGGAGDIGLLRLHHVCAFIEEHAKANDLPAIEAELDNIRQTVADSLRCLQDEQQ